MSFSNIGVSLALVLCMPIFLSAATLELVTSKQPVAGERVVIRVMLNAQESVNAIEGTLVYPREQLVLREIRDGNSLFNFWLERPLDRSGAIRFAGITPGGYVGDSGEVFSLLFDVVRTGESTFELIDARALASDGDGTPVALSLAPIRVDADDAILDLLSSVDTTPPEPFTPTRARASDLFDGRAFVAFATQDKESGVDHYEVAEARGPLRFVQQSYVRAESPFELSDQTGESHIYVRAVDKAGNIRTAVLSPEKTPLSTWLSLLFAILIALLLISYVRKRFSR